MSRSAEKQSFFESKPFAIAAVLGAAFGLLILGHHIASYENLIRPRLAELMATKLVTNYVDGPTFLFYFTNQSNIIADIYLILYAAGLLGSRGLYRFTHNDMLRGGITLCILATGVVYCFVLMPFAKAVYPMEKGIWFANVFNLWSHVIVPVFFAVFWLFPLSDERMKPVGSALRFMIYPLIYFIFSIVRGAFDGFYPYPFLNSGKLWTAFFGAAEYAPVPGAFLMAGFFILLCAVFFGIGYGLCAVHNKKAGQKEPQKDAQP